MVKLSEKFQPDNHLKTGPLSKIRKQDGLPFDNRRPLLLVIQCFRLSGIRISDVDCTELVWYSNGSNLTCCQMVWFLNTI